MRPNVTYSVYLSVVNHEGSSAYYACNVKLRNASDPLPNATLGEPSSLRTLYNYKFFAKDEQAWTAPLTFMVSSPQTSGNTMYLENIVVNNETILVQKSSLWSEQSQGYYYDFLIELWMYNASIGISQYNDRFVHFYLNVTS